MVVSSRVGHNRQSSVGCTLGTMEQSSAQMEAPIGSCILNSEIVPNVPLTFKKTLKDKSEL